MTAAAASPHRAVLHPAEEVFLPDTLGGARSSLHSETTGARRLSQAPRPGTVRMCPPSQTPGMRCAVSGPGLRSTETAFRRPGRYGGDTGETK